MIIKYLILCKLDFTMKIIAIFIAVCELCNDIMTYAKEVTILGYSWGCDDVSAEQQESGEELQ